MPRKKATPSAEDEPNFEQAIAELEGIVTAMEEEELPLEALIEKFDKGSQLLTRCESVLASAKKRLQTIAARTTPTDPERDPTDPSQSTDPSQRGDDLDDDDDIRLF